jgi:4-hydroxy-4-methyl-2-oxoglutarate aldolase
LHPNDPPVPVSHGSDQIIASFKEWKRLFDIVDSPCNGMTYDCGVTREMGEDPVSFKIDEIPRSRKSYGMKKLLLIICVLIAVHSTLVSAQEVAASPEYIKGLTAAWTGERSADGRPLVASTLLERLKAVKMEEAWEYMNGQGYNNQFENFASLYENGWEILHPDQPMTGRVVTAQFMPQRPDLADYVQAEGKKQGIPRKITNSAPLNILSEGDVYVADSYGKMAEGTLIGSNLGNQIYKSSKRGFIFNGSVRDVEGLREIKGANGFYRGSDPSAIGQMICVSYNAPIRLGRVSVLPGDIVLAKSTGVIFIPAHLLSELVVSSEYTALRDEFNFFCIRTEKFEYKNEGFVNVTPEELDKAFMDWLDKKTDLPMTRKELNDFIVKRKTQEKQRPARN